LINERSGFITEVVPANAERCLDPGIRNGIRHCPLEAIPESLIQSALRSFAELHASQDPPALRDPTIRRTYAARSAVS
jgi:hypothetical protein